MLNFIQDIFLDEHYISSSLIKLGDFKTSLTLYFPVESQPIYFILNECQRRINVVQFSNGEINRQNVIYLATFTNWYPYTKSLLEYFNYPEWWKDIKLLITYTQLPDQQKIKLTTSVYVTESYLNSFNNISDYSVSNNNCRIPKLISRINFDQINFKITIPVETGLLKNSPTTSLTDESIFDLGHFQLNRPLYPYQINNIKWMAQLENNIKLGKLNISSFERTAQNQLVFYLDNLKRYQVLVNLGIPVSENKPVETCQFTPKGGVLADHVGLGKTSSFIGLMAFQKLKRGNLGHKVSLVICPRRLCYQWLAEINLISDLNADIISNINQFRRVCETGIDKVDILILSYSFLNNLN